MGDDAFEVRSTDWLGGLLHFASPMPLYSATQMLQPASVFQFRASRGMAGLRVSSCGEQASL